MKLEFYYGDYNLLPDIKKRIKEVVTPDALEELSEYDYICLEPTQNYCSTFSLDATDHERKRICTIEMEWDSLIDQDITPEITISW
jgi:hypothetical protein